jgi:hypothetical protein
LGSRPAPINIGDSVRKITKAKRAGGIAHMEEHLPRSKCKVLSSNPTTQKRKEKGAPPPKKKPSKDSCT